LLPLIQTVIREGDRLESSHIIELIQQIRDRLDHFLRMHRLIKDENKWSRSCSALDTIEDTEDAVLYYMEELELEENNYGQIFLAIYGFMQALFVQQDAIEHLIDALDYEINIRFDPKDVLDLKEIRGIRNDVVGHPTDRGSNRLSFQTDRQPISKNEFHYRWTDENGIRHSKTVNTRKLFDVQVEELKAILERVIMSLDEKEKEYKEKFKNMKLRHLIKKDTYPWIPQMMVAAGRIDEANASHERSQGRRVLESIREKIDTLGTELTRRDFPMEGFEEFKRRIFYAADRLVEMFAEDRCRSINPLDAEIYARFVIWEYENLDKWTEEQDNYFRS